MPSPDYHLNQIEYHVACLRGKEPDVSPSTFAIPTGSDLRYLRKECELSVDDVADEINYSQQMIRAVEKGQRAPSRKLIQKLLALYRREWPASTGEVVR
ncbi:helix-turn-helix transcriptional regulator [Haloterrigena sp. SYSU A558-1]|uniref:Helix-turn-helix transcriptional regulator n=1 Tax=Haloterrigena gelatinilytica TaxID=2741724 RepID=A0ABX2LDU5_9EURY|nr:helix-turn-helix transcriptional regulator [Haloterrigena gelatinilytica]NUC71747.1 helix-turn-helix transcriptional regulator [Haloterrigena gelatinilytica]